MYQFGFLVVGASANPATDNYAGIGPFSEPETRHLSTFIRSIGDKIDIYLSFHSYGQLLLLPFGNTTDPVANYEEAVSTLKKKKNGGLNPMPKCYMLMLRPHVKMALIKNCLFHFY